LALPDTFWILPFAYHSYMYLSALRMSTSYELVWSSILLVPLELGVQWFLLWSPSATLVNMRAKFSQIDNKSFV